MLLKSQMQTINISIKSYSKVDQNLIRRYLEKKLSIFFKLFKKTKQCPNFHNVILNLPTNIRKLTLLKSPHVHKKAKQHFIQQEYVTLIKIQIFPEKSFFDLSLFESKLNSLFTYFLINCPNSVKITITWEKVNNNIIKKYSF